MLGLVWQKQEMPDQPVNYYRERMLVLEALERSLVRDLAKVHDEMTQTGLHIALCGERDMRGKGGA